MRCRNCDGPASLPSAGLDNMEVDRNPMVQCGDLEHINLHLWREE